MRQKFQLLYNLSLVLADSLAILAAFVIAYIIRVKFDARPLLNPISAKTYILIYIAILPLWIALLASMKMYRRSYYHKFLKEFWGITISSIVGTMALITLDFALNTPIFPARLVPLYSLLLSIGFLTLGRLSLRLIKYVAALYGKGLTRVLVVGSGDATEAIYEQITSRRNHEFRLEGIWLARPIPNFKPSSEHAIRSLKTALNRIKSGHVDLVVQTEVLDDASNQALSLSAEFAHVDYKLISSNSSLLGAKASPDLFFGVPSLDLFVTPLNSWSLIFKRLFDIVLSLSLIFLTSPLMLLIALAIKLSDHSGPILYKHTRYSRFGRKIQVLKFRTMYQKYCSGKKTNQQIFKEMGREDLLAEWGAIQKIKDDPRITSIGRFLRKTSLDELPQLFNVLIGNLSLVGPRAITKEEFAKYKSSLNKFLSIKAGLTGLWQVSGRNNLSYEDRVKLDVYYVQNWSIWLDIKILARTIKTIFRKEGE